MSRKSSPCTSAPEVPTSGATDDTVSSDDQAEVATILPVDEPTDGQIEPSVDEEQADSGLLTVMETPDSSEQKVLADPAALALELERIVRAVVEVQALSQRAREAAQTNLAHYDELRNVQVLHEHHLAQARSLAAQAHAARDQAFGAEAQAAADAVIQQAQAIEHAFIQVVQCAAHEAGEFLARHPDIEALVDERRRAEAEAEREQAAAARARQVETMLARADEALEQGIVADARRFLAVIEHDLPEAGAAIAGLRFRIDQRLRTEQDAGARQALLLAADQQAQGDLEAALATFEEVNVRVLSREVSEDVFGRWSDICSRLAQTAGASLKRFAPAQGRGLILYEDPAWPDRLFVFSSLGMGTGFPYGTVIERDPNDPKGDALAATILGRARAFREAKALPLTSWFTHTAALDSPAAAIPTRH